MDMKDIYTPLSEAKEEIWRRWNDPVLKKKVEDFLGGDIPEIFKKGPSAVLVRDIMTPNNEFRFFMDIASELELPVTLLEYTKSKFVAKNINKYHLCYLHYYEGVGKNGGTKIKKEKIVDFNIMEGKTLTEITTIDNKRLIDKHREMLFDKYIDITEGNIFDLYDWFNEHRNVDGYTYLHYLALFLCYGVLFENFILGNGEKEFTEQKILPSFYKLVEIFGIKPLIVPATPMEYENNLFWWYYKDGVE